MLNHEQSPAPRDQRSSKTTPLANEEDRPGNDQGRGHSQSGKIKIQFYRFGWGSETGREDSRRLELTSATPPGACGIGHSNAVAETTWQLVARPAETNAPAADEIEIKKRFGPNAKVLSSPHAGGKEQKFCFEELPGELQNVLRVQLRQAGDVSAAIETPGGFLLNVAKEKTDAVLSVAGLSLPKRSYEQWLEEQAKGEP